MIGRDSCLLPIHILDLPEPCGDLGYRSRERIAVFCEERVRTALILFKYEHGGKVVCRCRCKPRGKREFGTQVEEDLAEGWLSRERVSFPEVPVCLRRVTAECGDDIGGAVCVIAVRAVVGGLTEKPQCRIVYILNGRTYCLLPLLSGDAEVEEHQLVGVYYLCAVEMQTLYGIGESRLRTVGVDLRELICECDRALRSHEALVVDDVGR